MDRDGEIFKRLDRSRRISQVCHVLAVEIPAVAAGDSFARDVGECLGFVASRIESEQSGAKPATLDLAPADQEKMPGVWLPAQVDEAL